MIFQTAPPHKKKGWVCIQSRPWVKLQYLPWLCDAGTLGFASEDVQVCLVCVFLRKKHAFRTSTKPGGLWNTFKWNTPQPPPNHGHGLDRETSWVFVFHHQEGQGARLSCLQLSRQICELSGRSCQASSFVVACFLTASYIPSMTQSYGAPDHVHLCKHSQQHRDSSLAASCVGMDDGWWRWTWSMPGFGSMSSTICSWIQLNCGVQFARSKIGWYLKIFIPWTHCRFNHPFLIMDNLLWDRTIY